MAEGDVFAAPAEADAALAKAQAFVAGNAVVSPYLFDVHADKSPVKEREIIRAMGPSVRDEWLPRWVEKAGLDAIAPAKLDRRAVGARARGHRAATD